MAFLVPDGWPNPTTNTICLCLDCGLVYYDNDMTQADYDEYYRKYYGYDGNEHSINNEIRLDEIADLAAQHAEKEDLIVDFGGGNGYLANRLHLMGYRAQSVEVGQALPKNIDLLISAQTLEHLYDLRPIVDMLVAALSYKGKLLIEVPNCLRMANITTMPILDYHQKHVNHFTPQTLDRLFALYGFAPEYIHIGETPCYFGQHYRALYTRHLQEVNYKQAMMTVHDRVENKIAKMRHIDGPVIVWGCGDLCLHMLTKVDLDIAYYVDNDPAFKGATIGGKPVREFVTNTYPIVVIAQNQASGILKRIKESHLPNEVIVL
jgi:hypothetical protein